MIIVLLGVLSFGEFPVLPTQWGSLGELASDTIAKSFTNNDAALSIFADIGGSY